MPPITIYALNDLSAFQTIIQGKNMRKAKRILVETVTQMIASRWKAKYFTSTYKTVKRGTESDLLTALNVSSSMDHIKQVLRDYKQQFNDVQHRIRSEGNTSAFMRGMGLLVDQPFFLNQPSCLEKISKADDELMKLPAMEPEVYQQVSDQYSDKNPLLSGISTTPGSPSGIPARIHIRTGIAMKIAGYHPDKGGMCYGIAWTALLACVRQGGQAYMKRMQYLKHMDIPPLPGAEDIHQVYSFFDAVTLSMTNYKKMSGYEQGIGFSGRQEVAFPGSIIGGHEPGYQVPIVKHTFISECIPETFIWFLQQVRENNKGIPFGVMIGYPCHATSIGFDGYKWLAADNDCHYYTESTDLLCAFLDGQSNHHKDGKMIAVMEVIAGNEHFLCVNKDNLVVNVKKSVSVSLVLHLALQFGDIAVIADCITVIGQQAPSPEILLEQLTFRDFRGISGFSMALHNGHTDAITTFIKEIMALIASYPLLEDQKTGLLYKLLTSKSAEGTPGFCVALQNGHTDTITAFIRESAAVIAVFPLLETQKAKLLHRLLASKRADDTPGFFMALQNNYPGSITAFIQESAAAIIGLSLSKAEKATWLDDLLASKRANGTPGFFMALQKGHTDAVTAFIKSSAAVIVALSLLEEQKAELLHRLLASKAADGTPGFYMALQNDKTDTVTAFIQASTAAIVSLSLSRERKVKLLYDLLTSKKVNGMPGFFMALYYGYSDTVTAFIRESAAAVAILFDSDENRVELLYGLFHHIKSGSNSNFLIALKQGGPAVNKAFTEGIDLLPLSDEQKAKLKHPTPDSV